MYKLLLCWRYLRTRYIALASIVSVTLGVATMIVVNSVMEGFTREMQDRIHGVLSDVVAESHDVKGFPDAQRHMRHIERVAGQYIEAMTPTVHVPAMLSFQFGDQWVTRLVQLIGIDASTKNLAGDFGKYLQHPRNKQHFSFELPEGGYPDRNPPDDSPLPRMKGLQDGGWQWRRYKAEIDRRWNLELERNRVPPVEQAANLPSDSVGQAASLPSTATEAAATSNSEPQAFAPNPFDQRPPEPHVVFDPAQQQRPGCVLGIALTNFRKDDRENFLVLPGDDVKLSFPTAANPPKAMDALFTVVDFYESKMHEYDSNFVFVPIEYLQDLRGMFEPATGMRFISSIQIKLKDERDGEKVRDLLQSAYYVDPGTGRRVALFPPELYGIHTWRDKQGPLLAAVNMETAILNVLLFMIIAVAGFGILAIFFMIVVEKTRDIGILKSLGASGRGILGIFLAYGLSLGIVGSGAGLVLGLLFVYYINEIADVLSTLTGHEVFDPNIYYFQSIPTIVEPFTVTWIVLGALWIAVLSSVLPAFRAARLHPVEALRYE